jgi:hypothetical protein
LCEFATKTKEMEYIDIKLIGSRKHSTSFFFTTKDVTSAKFSNDMRSRVQIFGNKM